MEKIKQARNKAIEAHASITMGEHTIAHVLLGDVVNLLSELVGAQPKINELPERSKPSLMVGFSEEEIEQAGVDAYPYDRPGAHFKKGQAHRRMGFKKALRYANTRAVSIDKIIEVVREATWINDVDLLRERLMKMAALP